jgi:hypothetical protein
VAGVTPAGPATPAATVLNLQRAVGNRAVIRLLAPPASPSRALLGQMAGGAGTLQRTILYGGVEYDETTAKDEDLLGILRSIRAKREWKTRRHTYDLVKAELEKRKVPIPLLAPGTPAPHPPGKGIKPPTAGGPGKPVPPPRTGLPPVPPPRKGPGPPAAATFTPAVLTPGKVAEVLGTLEEWHNYASKLLPDIEAALGKLETRKNALLTEARDQADDRLAAQKAEIAALRTEVEDIEAQAREEAAAKGRRRLAPRVAADLAELQGQVDRLAADYKAARPEIRKEAAGAYYADRNADFRRRYKRMHQQQVHLNSTVREAKRVWENVQEAANDNDPENKKLARFRLLMRGGRLHAVMELIGTDFIANIVADPRNIVPESQADKPATGIAKALIGLVILENKRAAQAKGAWQDIELYALTNKVKGIYDRYGFRAFTEAGGVRTELPHERGVKEYDPRWREMGPKKMDWHQTGTMQMTEARANEFLAQEKLTGVLEVPADLKALLPK